VNTDTPFSQKIRDARTARRFTLKQAGADLGFAHETVRRWEAGQLPDGRGLDALEMKWGVRRDGATSADSGASVSTSGLRVAVQSSASILRVRGSDYGVPDELADAMMLLRRIYVRSKEQGNGRAWTAIRENLSMFASLPDNPVPPTSQELEAEPHQKRLRSKP
jgi:transcriptional regulator with XRE-family HTH domain